MRNRRLLMLVIVLGLVLALVGGCDGETSKPPVHIEPTSSYRPPPTEAVAPASEVEPVVPDETAEPGREKLILDLDAVPPDDVLLQVSFGVPSANRYWCREGDSLEAAETVVEIGEPIEWCACGFEKGEEFVVRLLGPDGEIVVEAEETASISPFTESCHEGFISRNRILPDDPLGQYTLEILGQDSTLELPLTLVAASRPTILNTQSGVALAGFRPSERVRLLAYKYPGTGHSDRFAGEWWVEVDEEGTLFADVEPGVMVYAIGLESGEAPPQTGDGHTSWPRKWVHYEGSLRVGAVVDATVSMSLSSIPAPGGEAVAEVPANTRMLIFSEPFSNGGVYWFKVLLEDGTGGWADESELRLADYEPNNSLEAAALLFWFPGEESYRYRAAGLSIEPGDEDWFALPLDSGQGYDVSVLPDLIEQGTDHLGLELWDADGSQLAVGRKLDNWMALNFRPRESGTYYLRIYGPTGGEDVSYHIVIDRY